MNVQILSPGEIIDEFASSKPIVLFTRTRCPPCKKLKAALKTFKLTDKDYLEIDLEKRTDLPGKEIHEEFAKRYRTRYTPKLFIGGKFVGGKESLELFRNGTLATLVKKALA
ncbi:glutaredoxin [Ancylostoma duodenale]|uniref:Glutaredoxin n=1 Tax=Ancylostoma duodenale TaxID=51022 RepID=A0A0C2BRQ2_9BILA|nr:glutaredoxin [Ancylostoma duodenale]